jgi:hypothetical protein
MNSTRSAWPAFMSACSIAESSADGSASRRAIGRTGSPRPAKQQSSEIAAGFPRSGRTQGTPKPVVGSARGYGLGEGVAAREALAVAR